MNSYIRYHLSDRNVDIKFNCPIFNNRIVMLLGISLLFRFVFLFYFHTVLTPDSNHYLYLAEYILQGKFYPDLYDTIRQPGYPFFLAVSLLLSGGRIIAAVFAQQLLGVGTAILTYLTARKFFSEKTAWLAGIFVALNPALAYFGNIIAMESLLIFLASLSVYLIANALYQSRWELFLAAGLVLGYMMGTKSISLLLTISACIVIILLDRPNQWQKASFVLLPTIIVFLSWSIINLAKFGYFSFAPSYGLNMLERTIYLNSPQVTDPIKTQIYQNFIFLKDHQELGKQADPLYWSLAVINTFRDYRAKHDLVISNNDFFHLGLRQIKSDPLGYARTTIVELAFVWAGYTPNWAKWRPIGKTESSDWSFLVLGPCLGVMMVTLIGISMVTNIKKHSWNTLLWILPVIFIPLVTALIIPSDYRYRLIVEPLVLTLVADGIHRLPTLFFISNLDDIICRDD